MNIPPFYVGQRVVAICDHSEGAFKKGQEFVIQGIRPTNCKCGIWDVNVGILDDSYNTSLFIMCGRCNTINRQTSDNKYWWFDATRFVPIQENVQTMTFVSKEVISKEIVCMN